MHHDIMNIPLTLVFGHQALLHGGYNAITLGSNIGGQYFFYLFQRLGMSEQETGVLIFQVN